MNMVPETQTPSVCHTSHASWAWAVRTENRVDNVVIPADPRGGGGAAMKSFAARHLPLVHFAIDALMFVIAVPAATFVRYDFSFSHVGWSLLPLTAAAVVLQGVFGWLFGQYRRKWQYGSFDEVLYIAAAAMSVGVVLSFVVAFWSDPAIPRSVPMSAALISLLGQVAARSTWRAYTQSKRRHVSDGGQRLIVVGAGEVGTNLTRMLLHSKDQSLLPVAAARRRQHQAQLADLRRARARHAERSGRDRRAHRCRSGADRDAERRW